MKKLIYSTLFLSFGTFAMAQQTDAKPMSPKMDPQQMKEMRAKKQAEHMDQMKKDLNLSNDQVSKINNLNSQSQAKREAERQQMKQMRQQQMAMLKKDREQRDAEMRQILTPEQYAKWDAMRKEKMEERKSNFRKTGWKKNGGYKAHNNHNMQPAQN